MIDRKEFLGLSAIGLSKWYGYRNWRHWRPQVYSRQAKQVVQPSRFQVTNPVGGTWYRAIPIPGTFLTTAGIPGAPPCSNIFAYTPPTLRRYYEIFGYSIGYSWENSFSAATSPGPVMIAELAFLKNGDVVHTNEDIITFPVGLAGGTTAWIAASAWTADLNNPISVEHWEILSIRMSVFSNLTAVQDNALIGIQTDGSANDLAYPSTISYNIKEY